MPEGKKGLKEGVRAGLAWRVTGVDGLDAVVPSPLGGVNGTPPPPLAAGGGGGGPVSAKYCPADEDHPIS